MAVTARDAARRALPAAAAVGLIFVYCIARYGDCVASFFSLDDFWILRDASRIHARSIADLWQIFRPTHTGFHLYRPFTQVGYFYALRQLFALDASGYHAVQILVYTANAVLAFFIARRVSGSLVAGLAAALLYASAPGHSTAVCWVAAFTMTGTVFVVLAMMWWWLRARSRWRPIGCALLQAIALLCSEHAVMAPGLLLLLAIFGPRREPPARVARHLLAPVLVVATYLGAKLVYFTLLSWPYAGYRMSANAAAILVGVGRYTAATMNVLALAGAHVTPKGFGVLGLGMLAVVVSSVVLAARRGGAWRLIALGSCSFVVALLPVIPIAATHYYDYFVGIAAFGAALTAVGFCRLLPQAGNWAALALAGVVMLLDVGTADRAARSNEGFRFFIQSSGAGHHLLANLRTLATSTAPDTTILVRKDFLTDFILGIGKAHEVFFSPPVRVRVYSGGPPQPGNGEVLLVAPDAPIDDPVPFWWTARWEWLRSWMAGMHEDYTHAGDLIQACVPAGDRPVENGPPP